MGAEVNLRKKKINQVLEATILNTNRWRTVLSLQTMYMLRPLISKVM